MPRDLDILPPHRIEGGALDTAFYIRRAHEMRSEDVRHWARDGRRAFRKAFHLLD